MDTKTAKQEALSLLALDELTNKQRERLNYLTATAAGMNTFYDPDNEFSQFTSSREWVRSGYYDPDNNNNARELPEFCTSVDACLSLPEPKGLRRRVITYERAAGAVWVWRVDIYHGFDDQTQAYNLSPSIALLHAWWQMQPE